MGESKVKIYTIQNMKNVSGLVLRSAIKNVNSLPDVYRGVGVIDFKLLLLLVTRLCIQVVLLITLPISVFLMVKLDYISEKSGLLSWVKVMREDKEFFRKHYYVELKTHIKDNQQYYTYFKQI